ncbi:MAG: metallophosphoesterase [Saprospiraceae bacterium]|nr:metallophosphoesterase [Candidatus Defluviibacterium haderslevense]
MPNPIYIVQITDLHLGKSDVNFTEIKQNILTHIRNFIEWKSISAIDMVVTTGDLMDKNGSNKSHNLAIDLLENIRDQFFKDNTKLFCTPGNHDLYDDFVKSLLEVNKLKEDYLKSKIDAITFSEIVDESKEKLIEAYKFYLEFMQAIKANNYKGHENIESLTGCEQIGIGQNYNILLSWINSSWLCMRDETWNESCKLELKFKYNNFDHERISIGNKLMDPICEKLNLADNNNIILTIAISHHDPKLLCYEDKTNYFHKLLGHNIVLNGHTHNSLFDVPFLTTGDDFISIIEVNLNQKCNIHYKLNLKGDDIFNIEKIIKNRKLTIFNNKYEDFILKLRSHYQINDLLSDIQWNKNELVEFAQELRIKYEKPKLNIPEILDYDLEQRSKI